MLEDITRSSVSNLRTIVSMNRGIVTLIEAFSHEVGSGKMWREDFLKLNLRCEIKFP